MGLPAVACALALIAVTLLGRPMPAPAVAAADAATRPAGAPPAAADGGLTVGAAKVDVTPTTPIRLCGYAARGTESAGIGTPLHARALAVGDAAGKPAAVVVAVDMTGISAALSDEVAGRVEAKVGVPRERFVLTCTHTHAAPCLTDTLPNIFGRPIPADQQARIDQYTRTLADKLTEVALAAAADLKPGTLSVARGKAGFATNRRKQGGPADQELPVLIAKRADGAVRAVWMNYACHCTTLGADNNLVNADWAGYAAAGVEQDAAGTVALVTLGCGADANPMPRGTLALAQKYGAEAAAEAKRLLAAAATDAKPVRGVPVGQLKRFDLAYDTLPTREQWDALAKRPDAIGFNARTQLAKLAAGKPIPTTLPYRVQSIRFGDDLTMVFLAGEVVVDYSVRLKRDFDPAKLWVTAYANDVPCYIPSRRILAEGGYEAEGAMVYYGRPGKLTPAVENDIVRAVHEVVPVGFRSKQSLNEFPPGTSVDAALKAFKLPPELTIEPVATEPLVSSPIAIDWDAAGRLWVLEMADYPSGLHENGTPGGRVKVLTDTDGDGKYDKATVYLDGLRYPMGLMCWGKGVLVCCAPDILYAEDADGDGTATGPKDVRRPLFRGFGIDNQQWEVNGLAWGLDGWVYGAGSIDNGAIQVGETGRTVELGARDFRMNPDTLAFEPAAGRTQFGRVRDDFDDWFGNDNSNALWHYPLPERYVRRNPHVPPPPPRVPVVTGPGTGQLFPASRTLERFNNPASANRITSACGPTIYRDTLLGSDTSRIDYRGNAFYCEPVHNLVQRLNLTAAGVGFAGHRTPDNVASEFLASTDNWFRPVQVRTGPDGALWVVDMHRFVIEHPRWITPERLAALDTRAGADQGRIYRIYPKVGARPRPVEPVDKLPTAELVARLENPSGTFRDIVHQELLRRPDAATAAVKPLPVLARSAASPAIRLQAMSVLDELPVADVPVANAPVQGKSISALPAEVLLSALRFDESPLGSVRPPGMPAIAPRTDEARLRRVAVRLAERRLDAEPAVADAVLRLTDDPDVAVRYQVALSLGEWDDARVPAALGRLAGWAPDDVWMRAAVVSSAARRPAEVLAAVTAALSKPDPDVKVTKSARTQWVRPLAVTLAATAGPGGAGDAVRAVTPADDAAVEPWQFAALADVLDAAAATSAAADPSAKAAPAWPADVAARLSRMAEAAASTAVDPKAVVAARVGAVGLLGRDGDPARRSADAAVLAQLLRVDAAPALQAAAVTAAARPADAAAADLLLSAWPKVSPAVRPRVFEALVARRAWVDPLLAALAGGKVRAADLSAAERDRLLKSADPAVRAKAEQALAAGKPESRAAAVAKAKPALSLKGDPKAGAAVFARTCAACHQLGGVGTAVGPNLAAVTDRSGPALLTAIVDPNAAVEGRYAAYVIETADGRTLSGLIADETAAGFSVLQGGGAREFVARPAVRKVVNSGLSLMPEGLEAGMTPQELADVIAFVQRPDAAAAGKP